MTAEWVLMAPNGVVSCLSWCLLTCNSFEDTPMLRVEDAPPVKELKCCREPWLLVSCSPSCLRRHTSRKQRSSAIGQGAQRWMLKIGDFCCGWKPWLLVPCSSPPRQEPC